MPHAPINPVPPQDTTCVFCGGDTDTPEVTDFGPAHTACWSLVQTDMLLLIKRDLVPIPTVDLDDCPF